MKGMIRVVSFLNAIYIILQFFAMFYIQKYMSTFFQEVQSSKTIYVLSHLVYPLIVIFTYFQWNIPVFNLIGNIVALFLITLNYRTNMMKRIACAILLYVFMLLIEVGVAITNGYLGVSALTQGTYARPIGMVVVSIILFTISLVFQHIKELKNNEIIKLEQWVAVIVVPVASIYVLINALDYDEIEQSVAIGMVIAILLIHIMIFRLYAALMIAYQDKLSSAIYEQEREYYYAQCNYMANHEKEIMRMKHDMKNHLLVLSEYFKACESKQGEVYISELIGENLNDDNSWSNTGNIAIDSVINFKLNEANLKKITVNADISVPSNLKLEASDITVIIGNLLDNAIQATIKLQERERKINILLHYDKGRLFVRVENSFDGNIKEKDGRFETMKNEANHGYGIKNIERVLEKYEGCIQYEYDAHMFYAKCMMYIKENVLV